MQLLDVQPGHDRLAGARVVGEQELQRPSGQQLAVHRTQLVRQRPDIGRRYRQHRIPQSGQLDPLALGNEPELLSGRVERPPFSIGQTDTGLGISAEHPLAKPSVGRLIRQLDDIRPMRLRRDHRHQLTGNDPGQPQPWLEVL